MIKKRRLYKRGFTLVEMLISIAILAIICGVVSVFLIQGISFYHSELESNNDENNLRNGMAKIIKTLHTTPGNQISVDSGVLTAGVNNFSFDGDNVLCNEDSFMTGISSFLVSMENNAVSISIETDEGRGLSTSFGLR